MSSAYRRMLTRRLSMSTPLPKLLISAARSLMNRAKRVGAKLSPCRTPADWENQSVRRPFTRTQLWRFEYKHLIVLSMLPCIPYASSLCHSAAWLTLSNAFEKSMNAENVDKPCCFLFRSIAVSTKIWSTHDRNLRKPFRSSANMSLVSAYNTSLLFSMELKTLHTQDIRLIPL